MSVCPYPSCRLELEADAVRAHLSHVHLGYTPFSCKSCGVQTTDNNNIRLHIKLLHPELNPAHLIVFNGSAANEDKLDVLCAKFGAEPILAITPTPTDPSTSDKIQQWIDNSVPVADCKDLDVGSPSVSISVPDPNLSSQTASKTLNQTPASPQPTVAPEQEAPKPIRQECSICQQKFQLKIQLKKHYKRKHPRGKNSDKDKTNSVVVTTPKLTEKQEPFEKLTKRDSECFVPLQRIEKIGSDFGNDLVSISPAFVTSTPIPSKRVMSECALCGKTMAEACLDDHMNWHNKIQPYKCNICDYTASLMGTARKHCYAKHKNGNLYHDTRAKDSPPILSASVATLPSGHDPVNTTPQLGNIKKAPGLSASASNAASPPVLNIVTPNSNQKAHKGVKPWSCSMCDFCSLYRPNVLRHIGSLHSRVEAADREGLIVYTEPAPQSTTDGPTSTETPNHKSPLKATVSTVSPKMSLRQSLLTDFQQSGNDSNLTGDGDETETVEVKNVLDQSTGSKRVCEICDRDKFGRRSQFIEHVYACKGLRPYHCLHCPFVSSYRSSTYLHVQSKHKDVQPLAGYEFKPMQEHIKDTNTNDIDMSSVQVGSDLNGTMDSVPSQSADGTADQSALSTVDQSQSAHRARSGPYDVQCELCEKWMKRDSLEAHMNSEHLGVTPYKCRLCPTTSNSLRNYRRHFLRRHTHDGVDYAKSYEFTPTAQPAQSATRKEPPSLKPRSKMCSGKLKKRPVVNGKRCPICGHVCATQNGINQHLSTKHKGVQAQAPNALPQPEVDPVPLPQQCVDCPKSFLLKSSLYKHRSIHHAISRKSKAKQVPKLPFACDVCGDRFASVLLKTTHRAHAHPLHNEKSHVCSSCGHDAETKLALLVHNRLKHAGTTGVVRKYPCNQCARVYQSSDSLARHQRMVHEQGLGTTNQRPAQSSKSMGKSKYECSECSTVLINWVQLRAHHKKHAHKGFRKLSFEQYKIMRDERAKLKVKSVSKDVSRLRSKEPSKCANCNETFSDTFAQQLHICEGHRLEPATEQDTSVCSSSVLKGVQCVQCERLFENVPRLNIHQSKSGHSGQLLLKDQHGQNIDKTEYIECHICARLQTVGSFKRHLAAHKGQQTQTAKPRPPTNNKMASASVKSRVQGSHYDLCPVCDKLIFKRNMAKHMNDQHNMNQTPDAQRSRDYVSPPKLIGNGLEEECLDNIFDNMETDDVQVQNATDDLKPGEQERQCTYCTSMVRLSDWANHQATFHSLSNQQPISLEQRELALMSPEPIDDTFDASSLTLMTPKTEVQSDPEPEEEEEPMMEDDDEDLLIDTSDNDQHTNPFTVHAPMDPAPSPVPPMIGAASNYFMPVIGLAQNAPGQSTSHEQASTPTHALTTHQVVTPTPIRASKGLVQMSGVVLPDRPATLESSFGRSRSAMDDARSHSAPIHNSFGAFGSMPAVTGQANALQVSVGARCHSVSAGMVVVSENTVQADMPLPPVALAQLDQNEGMNVQNDLNQ